MFNNLRELITTMPDEKACRDYLITQRWNGVPVCPYCGYDRCYVIEGGKRFKCGSKTCYKKFSVTVGTIFEASNIPLTKWLMAIYICSSHKKGISSYQLGKDIGIAQKSAWFMLHRIRYAFGNGNSDIILNNEIQADETFVGGRNENRHKDKKQALTTNKGQKRACLPLDQINWYEKGFYLPAYSGDFIIICRQNIAVNYK